MATGQSCSLTCAAGYEQTSTPTCVANSGGSNALGDGEWSPAPPSCTKKPAYCASQGQCSAGAIDSVCTVSCANGYTPTSPVCVANGASGLWTPAQACVPVPAYCSASVPVGSSNGECAATATGSSCLAPAVFQRLHCLKPCVQLRQQR